MNENNFNRNKNTMLPEYSKKYFADEEDIITTYLNHGSLQDKLDFIGIPASEIRGDANIDFAVKDTIINMPDDTLHYYAMKYCKELMEKGIKGIKYSEEMEIYQYKEGVCEKLANLIATEKMEYEKDDQDDRLLYENSLFDFEHYFAQLPFKALTQDQIKSVDPENKFFTGEYNDLYLNIENLGLQPKMSVQLVVDGDKEIEFGFSPSQMQEIYSRFDLKVEAYDKDRDEYHLCGLTNDIDTARQIAKAAFRMEQDRTDVDRDARHVPDIDWINITKAKTDEVLETISDENGLKKKSVKQNERS